MSLQYHYRPVNPRLGTHYAIFASTMAALVLILAMLEQLGVRRLWLSHVMIAVPLLLYLGVALVTRTLDLHEFFSAGRRVPAVFGGLSLAVTAIGGAGFFALTGCLYLLGFDALALVLGWGSGLVLCAILFTPFLRKSGAYTLPGFFRQRFRSRFAGALSALLLLPPVLLMTAAEIRIGAFVTSLFVSIPFEMAVMIGGALVIIITILGGMRSVSWTQCILYIVVIGAFLIPLTIVSVQITNLPLPQLTYGGLFEVLGTQEQGIGAGPTNQVRLHEALPGERPEAAIKPFLQPFGLISRVDFLLLTFCFMAGTAAMPSLLMRSGTAPSVFESRRALGWGALFFGLFLISAPAYAAFTKFLVLSELASVVPPALPDWISGLQDAGLAAFRDANNDGVVRASEMLMSRDGVTLALPIVADFPFVITVLVAAGGVSAAVAASLGHSLAAGTAIGEDIFRGLIAPNATPGKRLLASRLSVVAVVAAVTWTVSVVDFDILQAVAWALSLAASTFLPALALSIWWPRINMWGLYAALLTGFGISAAGILVTILSDTHSWFGLSNLLAAVYGVPAAFIAAVAASYATPRPSELIILLGSEIRDPSGETVHDRAVRLSTAAEAVAQPDA